MKYILQISEIGTPTLLTEETELSNERDAERRAFDLAKRFNCSVNIFRDGQYASTIAVDKTMRVFQHRK